MDQSERDAQDIARIRANRALAPRSHNARHVRFRVLVVDDEPALRHLMAATLGAENYELIQAGSGREALDLVRIQGPDLILLDVHLLDMSGLEVCTELKSDLTLCNIPVVLLTGDGSASSRSAGLQAEAAYYLTKPFSPAQLLATLRQLLAQDLVS